MSVKEFVKSAQPLFDQNGNRTGVFLSASVWDEFVRQLNQTETSQIQPAFKQMVSDILKEDMPILEVLAQ